MYTFQTFTLFTSLVAIASVVSGTSVGGDAAIDTKLERRYSAHRLYSLQSRSRKLKRAFRTKDGAASEELSQAKKLADQESGNMGKLSVTSTKSAAASDQTLNVTHKLNLANSPYTIKSDYSGSNFFEGFDFFTYDDPTHGLVNYVDADTAWSRGLVSAGSTVKMSVDQSSWLGEGERRDSVRITSKKPIKKGSLILLDATKIPYGPGVWPAFWTVGPNWPYGGEIDIAENVAELTQNQYTLHTSEGCTLNVEAMRGTGNILATNCNALVNNNIGCGIQDPSPKSWGAGFDNNNGGVFATTFDNDAIEFWFFERDSIPEDIIGGAPNPSTWGKPVASFTSDTCDISQFFADQTLVINTTLCGDWAGSIFNALGYSGTCAEAVRDPQNFRNADWEIKSVKIYTKK